MIIMTDIDREKLYEALQTIQDVCRDNGSCVGCPMNNDKKGASENCRVKETIPAFWTLNDPSDWRAIL